MSKLPLIASKPALTSSDRLLQDFPLLTRYNIFIDIYNQPNYIVDNIVLNSMPNSTIHNNLFHYLSEWTGKILYILLLCLPILDSLLLFISLYSCYIYWNCLKIHQNNMNTVLDPFKNMVFDPELCFRLHKDYYAFTIQFKQLEGFSLNYNKDMRKQINLRQERGKANFMIYNTNFWASYHHFGRWKRQHIILAIITPLLILATNLIFFLLIIIKIIYIKMRFQFCGNMSCPQWFIAEISVLTKITAVKMKLIFGQLIIYYLQNADVSSKTLKLLSGTGLDQYQMNAVVSTLFFILHNSVMYQINDTILNKQLVDLGLPKENVQSITKTFKSNRQKLIQKSLSHNIFISKEIELMYSIHEFVGSSNITNKKSVRFSQCELTFKNEQEEKDKVNFVLCEEQLDDLIYQLQDALSIMKKAQIQQ